MKIEKLTENKIRVIINLEDLKNNNMDFNTIMEKPIESQKLFLEMLLRAEKEVGFYTEGCKLLVEAFSSSDGFFVFTITKYIDKSAKPQHKVKVTPKKKIKNPDPQSTNSIYQFSSFEEFCDFCTNVNNRSNIDFRKLSRQISLYFYKDLYYLTLSNINTKCENINTFYSILSEFATLVSHSETFKTKLSEHGKVLIKKNAIELGIKYFVA